MFEKFTKAQLDAAVAEAKKTSSAEATKEANRLKDIEITKLKADQEIETNKLESKHEIELKEKEFEIRTKVAAETLDIKKELTDALKDVAVLTGKVEMLEKLVDVNADIIDIKDLFNQLIGKLPNVNIGANLALTAGGSGKKETKDN